MKITKVRIRSPKNYLLGITENKKLFIGVRIENISKSKLINSGFSNSLNIGEQVLPSTIAKVSNYNANGSYIMLKDKPKETVYRDYELTDWHGYSHYVSVPYERYQRKPIPAPNIELTIIENNTNEKIVISQSFTKKTSNFEIIKHTINLFLELYGECEILKDDYTSSFKNIKKLNWNVLPKGQYPWEKLKDKVSGIVSEYNYPTEKKKQIERRINLINQNNPDFIAVGSAGFQGYMIFGFPSKKIFLLESIQFGNATYIFGDNWEDLSKLSKKEILDENLHTKRIIHRSDWKEQIENLLK